VFDQHSQAPSVPPKKKRTHSPELSVYDHDHDSINASVPDNANHPRVVSKVFEAIVEAVALRVEADVRLEMENRLRPIIISELTKDPNIIAAAQRIVEEELRNVYFWAGAQRLGMVTADQANDSVLADTARAVVMRMKIWIIFSFAAFRETPFEL
jgi:hypothetical protein